MITYHVKHEIEFPFSPKDVRKKNYIEIVQQLISLGFTQVYIKENAVLVTGWISKDGSIEKMTVKNEESYKEGIMYDYDVDIKINYYTFPKKKN